MEPLAPADLLWFARALYLYYILNSFDFVKEAMLRLVSGSSSTEVKFDQLAEIYVPPAPGEDYDLFVDDVITGDPKRCTRKAGLRKEKTAPEPPFTKPLQRPVMLTATKVK